MQRIKIASVAATVQGVNAENFIKFCEALESWVAKGEDPLKLEVPSPVQRGDSRIKWEEGELVRSVVDGSVVVRVDGPDSDELFFRGTVIESSGLLFRVGESPLLRKEMFQKCEIPHESEIDWDRPQLVRSTWNSCVVETNGEHSGSGFSGTVMIAGNNGLDILGTESDMWTKSSFVYHGEIPQKQQQ